MSDNEFDEQINDKGPVDEEMTEEPAPSKVLEKLSPYEQGPDAVDISPSHDGGVMKEIKRPGVGDDGPMTGDKVFVHYVGTLTDGTKFDSSRDRGSKFEFTLGTGNVIKAWDIGVATMKRGELAVLLCKSEYAYGKKGSPPNIPPDATLVFEVELFDWKGEDVSEHKDEGVIRRQLIKGDGYQSPKDGGSCEIHIIGRCNGQQFEERDVTFIIGEGSEAGIVDGVEQALTKFKKGEKSLLNVKAKYGYGAEGNAALNIPPNADLVYEVRLVKFEKAKESWEMDITEKLDQSEISKTKGTDHFKAGKFVLAKKYYSKIVDLLKSEDSLKDEDAEKRKVMLLAGHLNLAMCHLKTSNDVEAIHSCEEALKLDTKNEKGLFRRGMANFNLQNFDEALQDFKAVLDIDPQNKAAKNQIVLTNRKVKQIHEQEKQRYGGMFQKFAAMDAKKEQSQPAAETKSEDDTQPEKMTENGTPEVSEVPPPVEQDQTVTASA